MGESNGVKAIRTMSRIVDLLIEEEGAGVSTIASELDLAKSSVHQQLTTLRSLNYVVKEDNKYHVGLRFLSIGDHARARHEAYHLAKPMVKQLVEECDERAQFFVEENGRAVIVYMESGERGVKADRHTGKYRYMHSSAGGKAMLAHMDRSRVESIIDQWGLPEETEATITKKDALFEELEQIREQGYAVNDEESISGIFAMAAPVVANDEVVGSFSVPGPRYRMQTDWFREELPDLLRGAANELEIKLEYSDDTRE